MVLQGAQALDKHLEGRALHLPPRDPPLPRAGKLSLPPASGGPTAQVGSVRLGSFLFPEETKIKRFFGVEKKKKEQILPHQKRQITG